MADEDFDPKGKGHLLALHILEKGFQTGSLIGGFFVVPFLTYKLGARNSQIVPRLANGLAISAITGTLLAGAAGAGRVYGGGLTDEGIEDRVYRLHYNAGQNRVDKFVEVSALVGAVATASLLQTGNPRILLGGAAAGAAVGVLAHVATYTELKRPDAMLEELKATDK